jgi:hypothetical protein
MRVLTDHHPPGHREEATLNAFDVTQHQHQHHRVCVSRIHDAVPRQGQLASRVAIIDRRARCSIGITTSPRDAGTALR